MKVSVKGMIEARRAFARLPEQHRDLIVDVHTQSASSIARNASARVPRRTDLLARSIEYVVSKRTGFANVGVVKGPAYYGHFIEFGTVHRPARPFMQPAIEAERSRIEARFIEGGKQMEREIDRVGGRFL